MATDHSCSPREERFCELYVRFGIASHAAEGAGYSPRRAKQTGHELLQRPDVAARIEQLRTAVAAEAQYETADLLRDFLTIAHADPSELVGYHRTCCRHCYGLHHDYQRTSREIYLAVRAFASNPKRKKGEVFAFLEGDGGPGWDPAREPNPDCPECFGVGIERMLITDTRLLSPAARRLYAGVKETKEGLEVKMLSQMDALDRVGKILGAFKEVLEHHDGTLEDLIRDAAGEGTDAGHA